MKFNISTSKLRDALGKILSIVEKNKSRPILNFAFIKVRDDDFYISATDLEVSARIVVKLDQNVDNSFEFCLNVKNLFDIVKELPSDFTELSFSDSDSNQLQLACDNIKYSLLTHSSEDFPHLSFENNLGSFTLSSNSMSEFISKTAYAISTDDTRPYLNGIFLHETEGKLRAIATNTICLSMYELNDELSTDNPQEMLKNGIIIPRKGVMELKKLVETFPDSEINISMDNSFLYASADSYYISVRLISREYPKYQTVIPSKTTYSLKVDKLKLMDAIRRIRIMSNEKSHGIFFNLSNNQIELTANHPSLGEAKEVMPAIYQGKDMLICFGAVQLSNIITSFDEGELEFKLNNEYDVLIIKQDSIPNYLTIIVPLKFR